MAHILVVYATTEGQTRKIADRAAGDSHPAYLGR